MRKMSHIDLFLQAAELVCKKIGRFQIEKLAQGLSHLHDNGGRLFILGVGGSAANASHAVNDFRKLCGIEAYGPTDNVAELTARANDEGWPTIFSGWLKVSHLTSKDMLLIFSVGGGDEEKNISTNLIEAIKYAKKSKAKVFSILGKEDGYAAKHSDIAIVIPSVEKKWVTPLSEAFQAVVWHALVSHPLLKKNETKW